MKILKPVAAALLLPMAGCMARNSEVVPVQNFYDIEVTTIAGDAVSMKEYKGSVLLIVNTASKCGFTGQYAGLQALHDKYGPQGLVVMGFPSNDFLRQEPGSNEEIASFCEINYGVSFPMFSKISVKGGDQHPLYAYLTSEKSNPGFGGKISWNFNKFLISREGEIVNRFGSRTEPDDSELTAAIESELKK